MVLLASGTGFAPIRPSSSTWHKGIVRPVTLYWGGWRPRTST
jgi:CDP-4-dehydro-6-deoxyglucose reductase